MSVHWKREDGSSDEVLKITTGSSGLQYVRNEFEKFITKVIGEEKMKKMKTDLLQHYLDLIRRFEVRITSQMNEAVFISFPEDIIYWMKNDPQTSIEEVSSLLKYSKPIQFGPGKLKWIKDDFMKFGDKVTKRIIEHINAVLVADMANVEAILLVGRLSNVVVNAVKKSFKTKDVVILDYSDVLKGALYSGGMVEG